MEQIITSLLDTDMYKFSMGQAIYHQFPSYVTVWSFKCRNASARFTPEMVREIRRQIKAYCSLGFTEEELSYLKSIEWIKRDYVAFLRLWRPRFEDFTIEYCGDPHNARDTRGGQAPHILEAPTVGKPPRSRVAGTPLAEEAPAVGEAPRDTEAPASSGLLLETTGTWLNTSLYEIPVLAIVNEVYFRMAYNYDTLYKNFVRNAEKKISALVDGTYTLGDFSEFGTRRRLSLQAQEFVIKKFIQAQKSPGFKDTRFVGTSNVLLAKKFGVKPVGTMGHEYIQCVGQGNRKHNPAYSNWYTLESWVNEYGVLNGVALTDTLGTEVFLRDFRKTYATLFSGVRHDSGDPYEWAEKMIAHYKSLDIDPKTKTLLFSDSLDFARATKLHKKFRRRARTVFGIGTYISNDSGVEPLNIVMKVTDCNDGPVAKLSDVDGKNMCKDPEYIKYLKRAIAWRLEHKELSF